MEGKITKKERREIQLENRQNFEELRIRLGSHSREKTMFMINLKKLQLHEEGKELTQEELENIIIPTEPEKCIEAYTQMKKFRN
jgi:hypothetical protein